MCSRLPRIRGGVSSAEHVKHLPLWSSPHTRGCFRGHSFHCRRKEVFPAYAGVFLDTDDVAEILGCLPRIRGGVSLGLARPHLHKESSPHTRGCFSRMVMRAAAETVFPAYAGVFPECLTMRGP